MNRPHPHSPARVPRPTLGRAGRAAADDRGAALLEFTLVLPVLLLVLMAVLFVGNAINESIDETHLVSEAARYAAVNQNPGSGTLQAFIKAQADTTSLQNATVCISFPTGTANVGDPVQVTMSSVYNWIPILKLGASTTLVRSATMRLEAVPSFGAGCA